MVFYRSIPMAKNWALMLCAPLLLAALPLFARVPKSERPRVCVLEFPVVQGAYDGWAGWGYGGGRASISGSLQDLMTTELMSAADGKIDRLVDWLGELRHDHNINLIRMNEHSGTSFKEPAEERLRSTLFNEKVCSTL